MMQVFFIRQPHCVPFRAHEGPYERFRLRGADSVTIAAQASHSGGNPMSQRECAGFNRPPLSIPAEQPVSSAPETVIRHGPANFTCCVRLPPVIAGVMQPPRLSSVAAGVFQPARAACLGSWSSLLRPSALSVTMPGVSFQSRAAGVIQPASSALRTRQAQPCFVPCICFCVFDRPCVSWACGVGHPVQSLADMGRAAARSAGINRPAGVTLTFQVSSYMVEPCEAEL